MTASENEFDALDRAIDAVIAGDPAAHPLAAAVLGALKAETGEQARGAHLAAIAAASPERSPEPDWRLATGSPERSPEPPSRLADITPITAARPPRTGRRAGRRTLVAALAAVLLLTLGSSTALAASQSANPGDPLYGVKRASERVALVLRRSPESKAALHLRWAERRLSEIETLAGAGRDVDALAADFAAELEAAADAGEDAGTDAILAKIRARTTQHIARLNEILAVAPEAARDGLERAIENAQRQGEKAEQRRIEKAEKKQQKKSGDDEPGTPGGPPADKATPPGQSGEKPGKGRKK